MAGGGQPQFHQFDYSTFTGAQNIGPESNFLSPVNDTQKYTSQQQH